MAPHVCPGHGCLAAGCHATPRCIGCGAPHTLLCARCDSRQQVQTGNAQARSQAPQATRRRRMQSNDDLFEKLQLAAINDTDARLTASEAKKVLALLGSQSLMTCDYCSQAVRTPAQCDREGVDFPWGTFGEHAPGCTWSAMLQKTEKVIR